MILNIHGLESKGNNSKYDFLVKNEYKNIISPTFDYINENPYNILDRLSNYIKLNNDTDNCVIGSSLGGFFAYCLNVKYNMKTILLNPSLMPFINLAKKENVSFNNINKYIEIFGKYVGKANYNNLNVIIGKNDEIIDHKNITSVLIPNLKYNYVNSDHRMEITNEIGNLIKDIIKKKVVN